MEKKSCPARSETSMNPAGTRFWRRTGEHESERDLTERDPVRVTSSEPAADAGAAPQNQIPLPTDRLWDARQAAAYLNRSVSWVYKAAERGDLPRARGFGWGLRFIPDELYAYAKGVEIPTADVVPIARRAGGA